MNRRPGCKRRGRATRLSLITKFRPGWYGTVNHFPMALVAQYVYSVLTGYEEPTAEIKAEMPEGKHYNPYFANGHFISMAAPLVDGQVTFDDGAPNTVDAMARDVLYIPRLGRRNPRPKRKSSRLHGSDLFGGSSSPFFVNSVKKKIWADQH